MLAGGVWPGSVAPHNINWCLVSAMGGVGPYYLGLKCLRPEGCLLGHGGRPDPMFSGQTRRAPPALSASTVSAWLGAEGCSLEWLCWERDLAPESQ